MIKYSKKALEDLAFIKQEIMKDDSVLALVTVTKIIDTISSLHIEDVLQFKGFDANGIKYFYKLIEGQIVFIRLKNSDILIDRIIDKDLDYIKLLFKI